MTFHTPVVLSSVDEVVAAARTQHWKVLNSSGNQLRLTGALQSASRPEPACDIAGGSFSGEHAQAWEEVLDWIESHVHRPLLVLAPLDPLTDLALWAAASRGWPFAALITTPSPAATPSTVALLTGGQGVFIPDEETATAFRSKWPAPVLDLPETPMMKVTPHLPVEARGRGDAMRVLLVGYYAGPCPTVGVQRINYWFERLEELSGGRITADLACATPWPDAPAHVHRVPDFGAASLALHTGSLQESDTEFLEERRARAYPTTRQVAGFWHRSLEEYYDARDDHFDVVVCSGNPFPYFEFAEYAQRRWDATTVLDYRDPFARSPRMRYTDAARHDVEELEATWNAHADLVTVVNDACEELVVPGRVDQRIEVVPNGFDERVATSPRTERLPDTHTRFVNAGQLFAITPPDSLLRALSHEAAEFHQIGLPLADGQGAHVVNHGRMPRPEVLARLGEMDCGVAYLTASGLETPTKVFDYLSAGLDVLVLHRGGVRSSALFGMLDGVDGVYWVLDEEPAIREFLSDYRPRVHLDPARAERFSRRQSTLRLIELLEADAAQPDTEPPAAD